MFLPDVNLWLALAFESHFHHKAAKEWFDARSDGCSFCRLTQQGFLRLATNPKAFGDEAVSITDAWGLYDTLLNDPGVSFIEEPLGLELIWREYTERQSFSPQVWNDAFLAAFARANQGNGNVRPWVRSVQEPSHNLVAHLNSLRPVLRQVSPTCDRDPRSSQRAGILSWRGTAGLGGLSCRRPPFLPPVRAPSLPVVERTGSAANAIGVRADCVLTLGNRCRNTHKRFKVEQMLPTLAPRFCPTEGVFFEYGVFSMLLFLINLLAIHWHDR